MPTPAYPTDRTRAAVGATGGTAVGIGVNLAILALGMDGTAPGAPYPGAVNTLIDTIVPFVWVVLFGAMGAAIALQHARAPDAALARQATGILLANCALYPAYTLGFTSRDAGLAGNVVTAIIAAFAAGASARPAPAAALLVAPVAVWVSLASVGLVAVMTGRTF